jgi:hypothetical protein
MAGSQMKTILVDVRTPDEIEYAIKVAKKKSKGVQLTFQYEHHKGLEIRVRGPLDRIKLFQKDLLETLKEPMPVIEKTQISSRKQVISNLKEEEEEEDDFDDEDENADFFALTDNEKAEQNSGVDDMDEGDEDTNEDDD